MARNEQLTNAISSEVNTLILLLEQMHWTYQNLLSFSLNEKVFLISSEADKLALNNQAKEKCLIEIDRLEKQRIELVEKIRQQLSMTQISSYDLRLEQLANELIKHNLSGKSDELKKFQTELLLLFEQIRNQNSENRIYAESAMQSLASAIENIKETYSGSKTYEKKGHYSQKNQKQAGNFIRKEI